MPLARSLSKLNQALIWALSLGAAGCQKRAVDTPETLAARAAWRLEQEHRMREPLSPLARIDYVHLPLGEHMVKPEAPPLHLAAPAMVPYTGELRLHVATLAPRLSFLAMPPLLVDGVPREAGALLRGNVIALGRLSLFVADADKDPSIAVYDPEAPARRAYAGLHYYPDDAAYVTVGRLERYPTTRPVRVAATHGEDRDLIAVGVLHFTLRGQSASIEAYVEEPGKPRLFLIFRDETSGKPGGSYGAGRYLYATVKPDGTVPLDFNQAWNPLCAYSPFFHCPVPPRRNFIPFAIPVGEKVYSEDH